MKCWNKICGFIAIFLLTAFSLQAQTAKNIKVDAYFPQTKKTFSPALYNPFVIAPNYYTQHFGFMCKKELAVEKFTKIPFRFRLGSLQQCNYYEGKK